MKSPAVNTKSIDKLIDIKQRLSEKDGVYTLDIWGGTTINEACYDACFAAIVNKASINFSFNGIDIVATSDSEPSELEALFHTKVETRSAAYRESDEYKKYEAEQNAEAEEAQTRIDELIAQAPSIKPGPLGWANAMNWVCEYAELSDWSRVNARQKDVAEILTNNGWTANIYVGTDPTVIESSAEISAQYIMGQVINCINRVGLIPPIASTFAERHLSKFPN